MGLVASGGGGWKRVLGQPTWHLGRHSFRRDTLLSLDIVGIALVFPGSNVSVMSGWGGISRGWKEKEA